MRFLRTNTAVIITVGPFYDATNGVTIETALTITNERITLTADTDAGAAPTNILDNITGATIGTSNDLNYITGNDAGLMQLELAAADVNRLGRMFLTITDAANHVPVFHEFMVMPALVYDTFFASSGGATFPAATLASTTNITAGTITTVGTLTTYTGNTPQTGDVFPLASTEIADIKAKTDLIPAAPASTTNITAGTITTVTNLTNAPTAGDLTATMKASVNAEVDTALADVNLDHLVGTAASIPAIVAGTYIDQMMDDGTAVYDRTTDSLQAIRDRGDAAWTTGSGAANPDVLVTTTITGLVSQTLWSLTAGSVDDNAYNGCRFVITDTSTATQKCVGVVNVYTGATKTMSPLNDPGIFTIANGDAISIMADRSVHPDIDNTVLDIDAATGTVGIDWGNIENKTTTNALTGTSIATVTTATTATNLTNAPTNGDLTATMKASVNAEVVDGLNVDTYAEPGQEAPGATVSLSKKIGYLYKAFRNRKTQTSTTMKLYADDATTVDQKSTRSDDGTTYDHGEIATGP